MNFEQLNCLHSKLDELLADIRTLPNLDAATVIIHGDHGSRVTLYTPSEETFGHFTSDDLMDTYSTLFAVLKPAGEPKYIQFPIKLQDALAQSVNFTNGTFDVQDRMFIKARTARDDYIPLPMTIFNLE